MGKFEIGDRVIGIGVEHLDNHRINIEGKYGTVVSVPYIGIAFTFYKVRFDGIDQDMPFVLFDSEIKLDPLFNNKEKREEMRLKMIEIDPFGEENWI